MSTVASTASVAEPVIAPVVEAVAPLANTALDAAVNPIAEPLISAVSGVVSSLDGTLGQHIASLLSPATGQLHLPVTGDLLTPLLGNADHAEAGLGAILGLGVSQDGASASGHVDAGTASAGVGSSLDHVLDLTGVLDHPHV